MQKGGVSVRDPRMTKMLALATDYFLAKTVHEARQLALLRTQSGSGGSGGSGGGGGGGSAAASASNAAAKGAKGKKKAAAALEASSSSSSSSSQGSALDGQGVSDIFLLEDLQRALADQGIHIGSKNQ